MKITEIATFLNIPIVNNFHHFQSLYDTCFLSTLRGWAGSFLYNNKAKNSLMNFYKRNDTLSLGVCNGCQLFIELGLLHPEHKEKPKMVYNDSNKFECIFTSIEVQKNNSVMFGNLSGSKLGIWSAHGEGKFILPYNESKYKIIGKYGYKDYLANPNGSNYNTAIISNEDGRHIAMMPHLLKYQMIKGCHCLLLVKNDLCL